MLRHQVIIASAFVTGSATGCVSGQDGPTSGDPNGSDPSDPSDPGAGDLTYTWIAGAFGTCSAVCGGGLQSRVVACVRSDGVLVEDNSCTSPRPDAQQACNVQSCTNTACTPALIPTAFGALTPTSGPAPLTVTFDVFIASTFVWDV